MTEQIDKPWAGQAENVARGLDVEPEHGLSAEEAERRRAEHGDNEIARQESESAWQILVNQFKSVIVLLLGSAAIVTFALGRWVEGVSISVVVVVNAVIGFFTELRAVRSMEALEKLSETTAKVRRDGSLTTIRSAEVVPGDVVIFEAGDTVSADMRLLEAARLQADESTLTGESVPVSKSVEAVEDDAQLAERKSMLLKGTAITRGSGEGVVTATGMDTELGAISADVQEAGESTTKLEERLDQLGRSFIWLTVLLSAIVIPVGWWRDKNLVLVVETAIALAVAAIPEGLPIVLTVALARGMRRMARRNALINRLAAVETLGSVTIIATDKTGTLTENQMTVREIILPGKSVRVGGEGLALEGEFRRDEETLDVSEDEQILEAVRIGVLCGNAELDEKDGEVRATGDPMEAALLVVGRKAGLKRAELLEELPEEREVAFDPELKMMATVHRRDRGEYLVAVKGAPEAVLEVCGEVRTADGREDLDDEQRTSWVETAKRKADEGLRVLAAGQKTTDAAGDDPYERLTFVGLYAFEDPPRSDVGQAIEAAHAAGIHTLMVTGDQLETARSIAKQLDMAKRGDEGQIQAIEGKELTSDGEMDDEQQERIAGVTVFSRVSPRQKLDLVKLHQGRGEIVAMTGDGVNDAPALERADIGIAMGQRGTQVAREAADVILEDDAFGTIVDAIKQGRVIFNNLRQFVLFLLTVSLSMIIAVFTASMFDFPIPVLPLQILFLNAVTHVFPALALGMGEGAPGVMQSAPREKDEPILGGVHWAFIAVHATLIAASGLGGVVLAQRVVGLPSGEAQTVGFLAVAFAQLWHVFNVRSDRSGVLVNEITKNRYVWWAVGLSLVLTLAVVFVPPVAEAMQINPPGATGWAIALALSAVPLVGNLAYLSLGAGARIGAPRAA